MGAYVVIVDFRIKPAASASYVAGKEVVVCDLVFEGCAACRPGRENTDAR
jgi:hypothetical protein